MDSWVTLPTLRSFGASIPDEMEHREKLWEAGPLPMALPALPCACWGVFRGTCSDGAHDRLRSDGAMHGHQGHQVLCGWLQARQAGVPAGAIQCDLLGLLLLVPPAVGEDEAVCWWRGVTPRDIHTGGCQQGEVQL